MTKKKRVWKFLLAILALDLLAALIPLPFSFLSGPYRGNTPLHSYGNLPQADLYLDASNSFGSDPAAFDALTEVLSDHSFHRDPRDLLPFLHRPKEPVELCVSYYTSCSSGGFLLWDDGTLWVAGLTPAYVAYHPGDPKLLDDQLMALAEQYR